MKKFLNYVFIFFTFWSMVVSAQDELKPSSDLLKAFEKFNKIPSSLPTDCDHDESQAEPTYSRIEEIDHSKKTADDFCRGGLFKVRGTSNEILNNPKDQVVVSIFNMKNDIILPISSHEILSGKFGKGFFQKRKINKTITISETLYPTRQYSQNFAGRGKENIFEVVDASIATTTSKKGKKSYYLNDENLRISQYTFFPRKVVPAIKVDDQKIVMTLTTGEIINIDKKTGRVVSGVAVENIVDNNTVKDKRGLLTYPDTDFSYKGEGLFIKTILTQGKDQRGPGSNVEVQAYADGTLQSCPLKSQEIWETKAGKDSEGKWVCKKIVPETDQDFYKIIREKCPDFKFPPLVDFKESAQE